MRNVKNLIIIVGILIVYILGTLFSPFGDYMFSKRETIKLSNEIRKDPEDISSYYRLAYLYIEKGNFKEAIKIYKKILKVRSDSEIYSRIAEFYLEVEPSYIYADSAKKYADLAIDRGSLSFLTLRTLGRVYGKLQEDSLAISLYQQALSDFFRGDSLIMPAAKDKDFIIKNIKEIKSESNKD